MSHIHTPDDPRCFVFGSNLLGIHGAGAARYARQDLGFPLGVKVGLGGNQRAYAIPTCSEPGKPLSLETIRLYVTFFLEVARERTDLRFFVSEVGCGLAGFSPAEIAPLFRGCPDNCDLPPSFIKLLQSTTVTPEGPK